MGNSSNNPDRAILRSPKAVRANDPERTLTEGELDHLLRYFGELKNASETDLRSAVDWLFRSFMGMAIDERFRESAGRFEKVPKPSTIVAKQMEQVQKACEQLDDQLTQLDRATGTWLDQHLKEIGVKDENGHRVRLRHLKERIKWPIDVLISAARKAEGITSRGPNNTALREMIADLANCWEASHGRPPTTDKGRGLQDDSFLELCQETAKIAHARLEMKGGGLGSLQLSGLVADVLKDRPS